MKTIIKLISYGIVFLLPITAFSSNSVPNQTAFSENTSLFQKQFSHKAGCSTRNSACRPGVCVKRCALYVKKGGVLKKNRKTVCTKSQAAAAKKKGFRPRRPSAKCAVRRVVCRVVYHCGKG